jgi:polyhydroxyalkanoate synthesis regulator phasin
MAPKKPLEKYVAAGKEFSETTRKRVQTIASDLAREGETGREQAEDWAGEFFQRGLKTAEQFTELVRSEIRKQIHQFNLATNQDVIKVVQQFVERTTKASAPARDAASRTASATKAAAKKAAPAKKASPAKKAAPATKAAAKKAAPAKKASPAKKAAPARKAQAPTRKRPSSAS